MATYTGEEAATAIVELMRNSGEANGLSATKIVEYRDVDGDVCWGVVYSGDPDQNLYERPNPYIRSPRVIWTRDKTRNSYDE